MRNAGTNNGFMVGIDIGATNFRIGLVDCAYQLIKFEKQPTALLAAQQDTLAALGDKIAGFIAGFGLPSAIVIGFPATVSKDKKYVMQSPNVCGFDGINFGDGLTQRFGCPAIVERDCNLLLAYDVFSKGLQHGTALGFYIGTGYGNALFLNGRFLDGKNGTAGELGHIPVYRGQEPCGCGNTGCIESIGCGRVLVAGAQRHFPGEDVSGIFAKHAGHPFLQEFVEIISLPIATEINILDPDEVIIGGGVVCMQGFPRELLEACVLRHTRKPLPAQTVTFRYATDAPEFGVLGAAYYARHCLL